MQFLVIRKADAETEAGVMPSAAAHRRHDELQRKARRARRHEVGGGAAAELAGARVSFSNGKPTVIDGPFAEAKELVAGFSVIEAGSLAEVIEMVKDWPQSDGHGNVQIEIRQIATASDLGFSEEQQKRYDRSGRAGSRPAAAIEAEGCPGGVDLIHSAAHGQAQPPICYAARRRSGLADRSRQAHRRPDEDDARRRARRGAGERRAGCRPPAMARERHPGQSRRVADADRQAPRHRSVPPQEGDGGKGNARAHP